MLFLISPLHMQGWCNRLIVHNNNFLVCMYLACKCTYKVIIIQGYGWISMEKIIQGYNYYVV